ncbi:hypothetical protein HDV00_012429 [Rhizophlyctis rosea]|nr:hypothetical protein HDV00_012429 [Rhizophlyctis rosea]
MRLLATLIFITAVASGCAAQNKVPFHCLNGANSGASTSSFVAGGQGNTILSPVRTAVAAKKTVYVTIQFGNNDQKQMTITYTTNMINMINQVKTAGGLPVVVTSLTRRTFKSGKIDDVLADWAGELFCIK